MTPQVSTSLTWRNDTSARMFAQERGGVKSLVVQVLA
jgi:hypothetical protein